MCGAARNARIRTRRKKTTSTSQNDFCRMAAIGSEGQPGQTDSIHVRGVLFRKARRPYREQIHDKAYAREPFRGQFHDADAADFHKSGNGRWNPDDETSGRGTKLQIIIGDQTCKQSVPRGTLHQRIAEARFSGP